MYTIVFLKRWFGGGEGVILVTSSSNAVRFVLENENEYPGSQVPVNVDKPHRQKTCYLCHLYSKVSIPGTH